MIVPLYVTVVTAFEMFSPPFKEDYAKIIICFDAGVFENKFRFFCLTGFVPLTTLQDWERQLSLLLFVCLY